jgi:hypothetical protein
VLVVSTADSSGFSVDSGQWSGWWREQQPTGPEPYRQKRHCRHDE